MAYQKPQIPKEKGCNSLFGNWYLESDLIDDINSVREGGIKKGKNRKMLLQLINPSNLMTQIQIVKKPKTI